MLTFLTHLLFSSLFLAVGGGVIYLLLRFAGCRSSVIHRIAWAAVLLLGILWVRIPIAIPVAVEETVVMEAGSVATRSDRIDMPIAVMEAGSVATRSDQIDRIDTPIDPVATAAPTLPAFIDLLLALFGLYLAGIAWFAGCGLFAWYKMLRVFHRTTPPDGIYKAEWESLLAERRISPQRIRLAISDHSGPGLIRLFGHHAIVVPRSLWEEADAASRRGILRHELSHYIHGDLTMSFFLRLIALIHWFNPMALFAVRRFEEATEWRCDGDAFGNEKNGVSVFAQALLAFRDTVPVTATYRRDFCGNNVVERAERLAGIHQQKGDSIMKKLTMISCVLLLLCSGLFRVEFVEKTTAQNTEPVTSVRDSLANAAGSVVHRTPVQPVQDVKMVNVRGRVLTPTGEVAEGINWMFAGYPEGWAISNGGGREVSGEFNADVPGNASYVVAVFDKRNRYAAPMQTITVGDASPEEELVFQFEEGVPLTATFVDEETGKPIPGLQIGLVQKADVPGEAQTWFAKTSDEEGLFQAHVMPGEYILSIDLSYTNLITVQKGIHARKFVVKEKEPVSLKFPIPAPFVGKVLNVDGTPAKDRIVFVLPQDIAQGVVSGQASTFTRTDQDGLFRRIQQPVNVTVSVLEDPGGEQYFAWFGNELADAKEHTFQLVAGTEVTGRLVDAKTNEPLADHLFFFRKRNPNEPNQEEFLPGMRKTDASGRFSVRLNSTVLNDMFVVYGRQSMHGGGPYEPRLDIALLGPEQLAGKESVDLGDILIKEPAAVQNTEPAAQSTEPVTSVRYLANATGSVVFDGQIIDRATQKPIAGVTVGVQCWRGGNVYDNPENCFAESFYTTDAEGKYRFTITPQQVAEKDLHIKIMTDHPDYMCYGFAFQSYQSAAFSSVNETGAGRFGNFELDPAVQVFGRIVDPDGKPVYPCNVNVFWVQYEDMFSDRFYGITDRDGKFASKVEPGKAGVVKIIPRDFAPKTVYFTAEQAGNLGTIQVERGMILTGKTVDAEGKPLGNVRINVQEKPDDADRFFPQCLTWRTTDSDAEGNFKTRPLMPGRYRIIALPYTMESPYGDVNHNQFLAGMVTREHMAKAQAVAFPERLSVPGIFAEQTIDFKSATPIEYRAAKTHTISFRCLDESGKSFGKPVKILIFGKIDGQTWQSPKSNVDVIPDGSGNLSVQVPQGLTDAVLMVHTEWGVPNQYDNHPIRYRLAKDAPMKNDWCIHFGTIDKDVSGVEIYPYKAGRVVIYAKDTQGQYFDDYRWYPSIKYENRELYDDNANRFSNFMLGFGRIRPDMDITSTHNDTGKEVPARAYSVWTLADEPFDINVRLRRENLDTRSLKLTAGEEIIVTFTLERDTP